VLQSQACLRRLWIHALNQEGLLLFLLLLLLPLSLSSVFRDMHRQSLGTLS
jgi:hypothetical protein